MAQCTIPVNHPCCCSVTVCYSSDGRSKSTPRRPAISLLLRVTPVGGEAKSEAAVGDGSSSSDGIVVAGNWLRYLQ